MDRKKNKERNSRLDEFLEKKEPLDDFEKEALEGYQLFEHDDAAKSLNELDARFSKQLQSRSGKEHRRSYWAAAAALLIVSAFTGYFLLQEADTEKDLAIKQETQKVAPQTPEEAKPAEAGQILNEAESPVLPAEPQPPRKQASANKPGSRGNELKDQANRTTQKEGSERELTNELSMASNAISAPVTEADAAAMAEPSSPPSTAPEKTSPQAGAGIAAMREDEKQTVKRSAKKSEVRAAEPQSFSTESESPTTGFSCYFIKGEKELQKLVAGKLVQKELLKKFDATLFVDRQGVIDSVQFINPFGLSSAEQGQITNELKGLGGFKLANSENVGIYTLIFRP